MQLTKSEFILKQLNKSKNKIYEGYISHNLFNLLKKYDLKFTCQQYVKLASGNYALLDIFFPDLSLQIEIDEAHHENLNNIKLDASRQKLILKSIKKLSIFERNGIINLTNNLKILRIKVFNNSTPKTIKQIDKDIKNTFENIKKIIKTLNPQPWNYSDEYSFKKYKNKTSISITDNIQLRYISDVINLFGGQKDGTLFPIKSRVRGYGRLIHLSGYYYWCPQLSHPLWNNDLINNGRTIKEKKIKTKDESIVNRITFLKAKDNLGNNFYSFVGVFRKKIEKNGFNYYQRVSDTTEVIPVKNE